MAGEERIRILEMLKNGKISVEEAGQLLDAVDTKPQAEPVAMKDKRGRKAKKLHIVVDSEGWNNKNSKVNLSIPISLIRTLGPVIAKNIPSEAKTEMGKQGIDIGQILEDVERMLDEGLEEDFVDINTGENGENAKVHIYVD